MALFNNLFGCMNSCVNPDNQIKKQDIDYDISNINRKKKLDEIALEVRDLMKDVELLRRDVDSLFNKSLIINQDIKRLEDKFSSNFNLLQTKIDNILLILNRNNN